MLGLAVMLGGQLNEGVRFLNPPMFEKFPFLFLVLKTSIPLARLGYCPLPGFRSFSFAQLKISLLQGLPPHLVCMPLSMLPFFSNITSVSVCFLFPRVSCYPTLFPLLFFLFRATSSVSGCSVFLGLQFLLCCELRAIAYCDVFWSLNFDWLFFTSYPKATLHGPGGLGVWPRKLSPFWWIFLSFSLNHCVPWASPASVLPQGCLLLALLPH